MADDVGIEPTRPFQDDGLATRCLNHSANHPETKNPPNIAAGRVWCERQPQLEGLALCKLTDNCASKLDGLAGAGAHKLQVCIMEIMLCQTFLLIIIWRPSRRYCIKPSMLLPISWHMRRGLTGLT